MLEKSINPKKWFAALCTLHLLAWTIITALVRNAVPHDVAEGIAWGNQWQLGYDKHPPLTAWLCAIFTKIGGTVGWPVYLLAQIAVITSFWAIWRLANRILSPIQALVSVMLLEGVVSYSMRSPNITPDTMQTPIWALIIFVFYLALNEKKLWHWLLVGLLAGLAFLTKYQAALIYFAMMLVFLFTQRGRESLKTKYPYFALGIFLLIITPHLIWAYNHNFPAITYALASTVDKDQPASFLNNFIESGGMIIAYIGAILGALIMLLVFSKTQKSETKFNKFNWQYIFIMGLTPAIITILYPLITGGGIVPRWDIPYFNLLGIMAMMLINPKITIKRFRYFIYVFTIVALTLLIGRNSYLIYYPQITGKADIDTSMPIRDISKTLTDKWHSIYKTPLSYIAGEHYLTAFISIYSNNKPTPYMDYDKVQSPWINEADLKQKGAIFAWQVEDPKQDTLPPEIAKRFPNAQKQPTQIFQMITPVNIDKNMYIATAILPPEK